MEGKWAKGPWRKRDRYTVVDREGNEVAETYLERDTDLVAQTPEMAGLLERVLFHFGQYPTGSVEESVDEEALAGSIRALLTAIKGE